jgi:hypothetical protein
MWCKLTTAQACRTLFWFVFNRKKLNAMVRFVEEGRTYWAAHETARQITKEAPVDNAQHSKADSMPGENNHI